MSRTWCIQLGQWPCLELIVHLAVCQFNSYHPGSLMLRVMSTRPAKLYCPCLAANNQQSLGSMSSPQSALTLLSMFKYRGMVKGHTLHTVANSATKDLKAPNVQTVLVWLQIASSPWFHVIFRIFPYIVRNCQYTPRASHAAPYRFHCLCSYFGTK